MLLIEQNHKLLILSWDDMFPLVEDFIHGKKFSKVKI